MNVQPHWTFLLVSFLFLSGVGCSDDLTTPSDQPRDPFPLVFPLTQGVGAGGVAFDGDHFWISAQSYVMEDRFLKCDRQGNILDVIYIPRGGNVNGGLTFDGQFLYNLSYNTNQETGYQTIDRFDLDGQYLESFPAAGGYNTFGLVWTGDYFYQGWHPTRNSGSELYRLDRQFNVLQSESLPIGINGLAWDGNLLWISTGEQKMLYTYQEGIIDTIPVDFDIGDMTWVDGQLYGIVKNANRLEKLAIRANP